MIGRNISHYDTMTPPPQCSRCGRLLTREGAACPECTSRFEQWRRSRATFVLLSVLLLAPLFAITGGVVRLFHAKQQTLASEWSRRGNTSLAQGRSQEALEEFRNALHYAPDSSELQLALARALYHEGRLEEAESYLLNLRTTNSENPEVSLDLARVLAARGRIDEAVRRFHEAIYGNWSGRAKQSRLAARSELIELLFAENRREEARAESVALSAEYPFDPAVHERAGGYLERTGNPRSALQEYRAALKLDPKLPGALAGAGRTALALGEFAAAQRDLKNAEQAGVEDDLLAPARAVAARGAALDPVRANLAPEERRRRILHIFEIAEARAQSCFPGVLARKKDALPADLEPLAAARRALPARVTELALRRNEALTSQALAWTYATEKLARTRCGSGDAANQALLLLAQREHEREP
jgi:tetratricopeptide (TPR) repeat protein